ncbi:MAG TPA: hypothetical protein VIA61_09105 [Methylomirabilota bacterium]|jgi:uncharacterized membrane protein YfcA
MADEAFDPKTVTVEQLAAYARQVRLARIGALIAGLVGVAVGYWITNRYAPDWVGIVIIVLLGAGAYRLVYEVLKPRGANIKTD